MQAQTRASYGLWSYSLRKDMMVEESAGVSPGEVLITQDEIRDRVHAIAKAVAKDFRDTDLVVVGVLKGAFLFVTDLVRALGFPVQIEFVRASSYRAGTESNGRPDISPLTCNIEHRHVLIVEDIVDTGYTLRAVLDDLASYGPAGIRVCTLLNKPSRRRVDVPIDYVGFVIPDRFVIGYGLDHDERYRTLPFIAALDPAD